MNATEVIESYVRAVASYLPRAKRNDVAFELRALLGDELAAKARAEGRAPDKAMAMTLLKGFGRPAEAAGRYHEPPAVIDPADTHHFLIWALAGAVTLSVVAALSPPGTAESGDRFLHWLGALVIIFALRACWRRRRPRGEMGWKPKRVRDFYHANRLVSLVLGALTLIPLSMYAAPRAFTRSFFFGGVPTDGLVLDPGFAESPLRAATIAALGLQTAIYAWVAADGRWRPWTRWVSILVVLAIGVLAGSHVGLARQHGVFLSPYANTTAEPFFGLVSIMMVLSGLYEIYRDWSRITPAPALRGA